MEESGVARLRMVDLCSSEQLNRITLSLLAPQLVPFKTSSNGTSNNARHRLWRPQRQGMRPLASRTWSTMLPRDTRG